MDATLNPEADISGSVAVFKIDEMKADEDPEFITLNLAEMAEKGEISSNSAVMVLHEVLVSGDDPRMVAEGKNLLQVSDEGAIAAIVDEVLADPASAASIADIKAGKDKAIGYLVGQIMKKSQGQANPALAQKLIRSKLL